MRGLHQLFLLALIALSARAAESAANPVATFRVLLAMRSDARTTELAAKPARVREVLVERGAAVPAADA